MKIILYVVGGLLIFGGAVWVLQGINIGDTVGAGNTGTEAGTRDDHSKGRQTT